MNAPENVSRNTLAAAFVKAQRSFAPALKESLNPHFKSKYVNLAGCVEAVIDALNANGIALMQHLHESEVSVIVETVFLHESGETMTCGKLHIPVNRMDAQGFGASITYARRYSLMAACGIAPEDDDGNLAARKPKNRSAPVAAALQSVEVNPEDQAYLAELAAELVEDVEVAGKISHAFDRLETAMLDSDQKLVLWGLLAPNSKTRSALKKEGDSRRAAAKTPVTLGEAM